MHWNRRTIESAVILATTVAIGVTAIVESQRLAAELTRAALVMAPAVADASAVERQVGTTHTRLETIVASSARHEMQNVSEQAKYLASRREVMTSALERIQQQSHDEAIRASLAKVQRLTGDWWRQSVIVSELAAQQKQAAAEEGLAEAKRINDQAQVSATELTGLLRTNLETMASDTATASARERIWLIVLLGAAVLVAISRLVSAERISRRLEHISGRCVEGGNDLATASAQVSTSAQSLAQTASEQAASLEETSATMEELASMTSQNADHAQQVASLMHAADLKATESNQAMTAASLSMSSIEESSQKVSRILKTIDEITFQTNILALNAAVEAARAGEAGLGFAAVAEEVRNLAQRSAAAAKETATLVEESVAKARDGKHRVEQLAAALGDITTHVRQVREVADDVCTASRQQAQGINQVSEAIAQLEQITQTLATTSEENAAASEEVSAQSNLTLRVAADLYKLVGGRAKESAEAPKGAPAPRPTTVRNVVKLGPSAKAKPVHDVELASTGTYRRF